MQALRSHLQHLLSLETAAHRLSETGDGFGVCQRQIAIGGGPGSWCRGAGREAARAIGACQGKRGSARQGHGGGGGGGKGGIATAMGGEDCDGREGDVTFR
jgi:hypothetical protein